MSNDNDNLMSSADGGHVLESEDARKSRLSRDRDRQRKHRNIIRNRGRGSANLGLRKAEKKGKGEIISPFPKTMRSVKLCFIVYSTRKAHYSTIICRIFL